MVEFKVKWSILAKNNRKEIFEYYNNRNGNKNYSKKLNALFNSFITKISNNPFLGKASEFEDIRILIVGNYEIIYQIEYNFIHILMIWDCRMNPENKIL